MSRIRIDFTRKTGTIKPMHAVNNGVVLGRQNNTETYRAAGFPYARNHDASYCEEYGVEHCVDITAIFRDFEANPYHPDSYDFAVTDAYLKGTVDTGTKIFYRLGQRIEHTVKKYNIYPPKDFQKWAVICEHIIRHYTEGWADGFQWDMPYWEIWNEPDVQPLCWVGSTAEFCDFFCTVFAHLKQCFPHLKIGGPALGGSYSFWMMDYLLAILQKRELKLDFFSWHLYTRDPHKLTEDADQFRRRLDAAGQEQAESILNEWNYCESFEGEAFTRTVETIIGMKGAAFDGAFLCEGQRSSVDLLMYYDARPSVFNGIFDFYTMRPLKGYHVFAGWNELYKLGAEMFSETDDPDLYAAAAAGEDGKSVMIVYYTDRTDAEPKDVQIDADGLFDVHILSRTLDGEKTDTISFPATLTIHPNTVLWLRGV
ncbi:MAG: hypothetical protein IKV57_05720 [Clostridia bacterium]|nr:hypothetical protein [Clostridia bacterium]